VNATATFPLRIAGLTIDPVRRHVAGPGGETVVEPLVMRLLVQLAERQGEVLPRRELFDRLWGNAQVGDDSLNRLVGSLRKALESTSNGAVEIETVPRVGYRLIAEPDGHRAALPISRRSLMAIGACSLLAIGGAGLWRTRSDARAAETERWIDRGDVLLRDAVPIQASDALPPLRSALAIDPGNAKALGLMALAEETSANNGGSKNAGETLRAAESAARAALQSDPDEPHARLAMIDMTAGSLDWAQMEDRLEAVRASAPENLHVLAVFHPSSRPRGGHPNRGCTMSKPQPPRRARRRRNGGGPSGCGRPGGTRTRSLSANGCCRCGRGMLWCGTRAS